MQHVFIIGSKGIPGSYGGYETFVDKLTEYHQNHQKIKYHVACKGTDAEEFEYHNARCFKIKTPKIGPVQAVYYDVAALISCITYIKRHKIENPIVYVLACRIGFFMAYFRGAIHRLGGKVYLNPDGHEWKRAKWSAPIRKYWKISEMMMVKNTDLVICDSKSILEYIEKYYLRYSPRTTYISYGAETKKSVLEDSDASLIKWYTDKHLAVKSYYLIVGRFVPENNFETMIREYMSSNSKRDLAIITTCNHSLLSELEKKLHFKNDPRIKFVGSVYNQELLKKIRENAYGYIHGHEVGGTNPSLLEALGSTEINLLLNVNFNKEVGEGGALYWSKSKGGLSNLIKKADSMSEEEIKELGMNAKNRILLSYTWEYIAKQYENLFTKD